ncbi:prepilin peptidase [Acidocella sp.]|uniref:A24 family peptidase n=1 Tax=Acidocella sp. TaxID=50710 RepID=UPI00261AF96F|nr:prepilin peptidase [Acidocella sp.]
MRELMIPAAFLLIYAALHDLAVRTVPNWLSVAVLVIGVAAQALDHSLLSAIGASLVVFLALFGIWMAGAMGGGDVKLWAAAVMLIPPSWRQELDFFLYVVLLGGGLAVIYLLLSPLAPGLRLARGGGWLRRFARAELWRIGRRGPLPYACAISGGALFVLMPQIFKP